jgi:hypothetical protein
MIEIEKKFLKPAIKIAQEIIGDAGKIFKVKDGDLEDLEFCLTMMTDADKHAWQLRMATINLEVTRKEREAEDAMNWERVEKARQAAETPYIYGVEHRWWSLVTDLVACFFDRRLAKHNDEEVAFYCDMIPLLREDCTTDQSAMASRIAKIRICRNSEL